jgi:hypothetical protein
MNTTSKREEVKTMKRHPMQSASPDQLRLLVSLHKQNGQPYDVAELAGLSKWEAAEWITALRTPATSGNRELDAAVAEILSLRAGQPEQPKSLRAPRDPNRPVDEAPEPASRKSLA